MPNREFCWAGDNGNRFGFCPTSAFFEQGRELRSRPGAFGAGRGVLFRFAKPIADRLSAAGMAVVTRLMGMIMATIAVAILADGLKGLMPGLA